MALTTSSFQYTDTIVSVCRDVGGVVNLLQLTDTIVSECRYVGVVTY